MACTAHEHERCCAALTRGAASSNHFHDTYIMKSLFDSQSLSSMPSSALVNLARAIAAEISGTLATFRIPVTDRP